MITQMFVSSKCNVSQELLVVTMWRKTCPKARPIQRKGSQEKRG